MCSPVRGRNGNVEFVLHLRGGAPDGADPAAIEAALGEAVALAGRAEGTT
jgi:hypothetical protein